MNAQRTLTYLILFLVLLALPIIGRRVHFYGTPVERPPVERPAVEKINVPTPPSSLYADEDVKAGDGIVVVDMAHDNQIQLTELNVLAGRLAARGHQLKTWTGGDLAPELREASALMVAVPLSPFEKDEIIVVRDFVESGGRLLLLGDPTRFGYVLDDLGWIVGIDSDARYLSSLGTPFGIAFVDDYLYNVSDNEGNFRNIKLSDGGKGGLMDDLDAVVFYAAHSLAVADEAAVIRADEDTWSSATDRAGGLVVGAQTADGRVLALGDLTFMTEPYHTVRDNSVLIARIADFLTGAVRSYSLVDFPLFYSENVSLAFTNNPELGPGQLQLVDTLQEVFDETDQTLLLSEQPYTDTNALYLGLYSQFEPVAKYLDLHGITLTLTSTLELDDDLATDQDADLEDEDDLLGEEAEEEQEPEGVVSIEGMGTYDMSGIALVLLHEGDGYKVLVVLSASQEGLSNMVGRLPDGDLYDCVSADAIALCPTGVPFEEVEMDWEPTKAEELDEEEPKDDQVVEDDEDELPDDVQGELSYGDTVSGELAADEEQLWAFGGTAGDEVDIVLETEDLDAVLALIDPEGEELVSVNENPSSSGESLLAYSLPSTGDYTIRVTDFYGAAGGYSLSLELLAAGDGEKDAGDGDGDGEAETGGVIGFGETVEGELGKDVIGIWTFDGAADQALTIIVQPNGDTGDLILRLQDENGDQLVQADDGFSGEEERIEGVLPQDGEYSILVEEWYGDPVSYTLSLEEGGEGPVFGGRGILVVSADAGEPLLTGQTSANIFYDVLSADYDVTLWTLSTDGALEAKDWQSYKLVIWSSGDFQGDELTQLEPFLYMAEGTPVLMSGSALGLLSEDELSTVRDVQVAEGSSLLTEGLAPGDVYELSLEIDALVFDFGDDEEDAVPVFLRGPASDAVGDVIAVAIDEEDDSVQAMLIGFPLYLLPDAVQSQIILNAAQWFAVNPLE